MLLCFSRFFQFLRELFMLFSFNQNSPVHLVLSLVYSSPDNSSDGDSHNTKTFHHHRTDSELILGPCTYLNHSLSTPVIQSGNSTCPSSIGCSRQALKAKHQKPQSMTPTGPDPLLPWLPPRQTPAHAGALPSPMEHSRTK